MINLPFLFLENDTSNTKYKWVQTKLGGIQFSPRCSMPIVSTANHLSAYCYGGVFDTEDDEENLAGNFYNDMFQLDLEKFCWRTVNVTGKRDTALRRRKNKNDEVENGK